MRISIVTATLNRKVMLERAIRSAMAQDVPAFEHIVVDGLSADGTLDMLGNYPHLTVISEGDANLYEGWNKGIRMAKGDVICILNSDDELPEGAFSEVARIAALVPDADMISGAVEIVRHVAGAGTSRTVIDDPAMINLREQDIGPGIPLTNGRYLSPRLLERIGLFDERYAVVSDRQFFLRALLADARNATTATALYTYHVHGGSLTLNDAKPSLPLARQCLQAARDGVREAPNPRHLLAYLRWHAWASFYLLILLLRERDGAKAWSAFRQSFAVDPAWLLRLPTLCVRHVLERKARRGRRIG
jgi:glycosyltransferase involved in cell wall biosynthesis